MGVLQQIWLYEIIGGMLLMCQNTTMQVYEAWIKTYYVYVQKHIVALENCHNPPLVRDKPLGVPASVKLVYSLCCMENSSDAPTNPHHHDGWCPGTK